MSNHQKCFFKNRAFRSAEVNLVYQMESRARGKERKQDVYSEWKEGNNTSLARLLWWNAAGCMALTADICFSHFGWIGPEIRVPGDSASAAATSWGVSSQACLPACTGESSLVHLLDPRTLDAPSTPKIPPPWLPLRPITSQKPNPIPQRQELQHMT